LIQNLSSFEYSVYSFDPGLGKAFRSSGACNWAILVARQSLAQEIVSFGRRNLAQLEWCKPGSCSRGDLIYLTSHCGNTIGCGEILCFLTNNLGDDVAVLKKCTCRRWLKPLPNGKTEGAIKLCPCKTYGCSDFCQRPAEDHNFDSLKLWVCAERHNVFGTSCVARNL
jgi:hypothetical protein